MTSATLYGVGVGPGDPELITLKAHRLIRRSPVLAYLSSRGDHSMARAIAEQSISGSAVKQIELAIDMPMAKDRTRANQVYDQAAKDIAAHLAQGSDVVFLCEGDPFFFGSFAYLHERLSDSHNVEIIPGVSSLQASAAAINIPLAILTEKFAVVSGRHTDQQILQTLRDFDSVAIMKPGSQRERLLELVKQSGRTADGCYIEYTGHSRQRIVNDLSSIEPGSGPYFSLLLINRARDTLRADQD